MSYKLHILIDHSAPTVLEAIGLTEEQGEQFIAKTTELAMKVSDVMLGESKKSIKKTELMEAIQETFTPAEILLLALHGLENTAIKICERKSNPMPMFAKLMSALEQD